MLGEAVARSSDGERLQGASSAAVTQASVAGAPRTPDEPLAPGARLGRYVLAEQLGQGGMGTVYAAHDPDLDRRVAIKVLHADLAAQDATGGPQRLLREAQAMAKLSHPNVVTVHDVGVVGARLFIAMEMIDGSDLRGWLAARSRSWRAIVEVFIAAGAGLAAAHDAGIIHRDFKPDNVLMASNGRVLVGDFGIAAAAPDGPMLRRDVPTRSWLGEAGTLTVPGALLGTPAYMAPEQMAGGEITPAVDIFAFCVALYEALEGARPFRGDTLANLFVAINDEGPRPLSAKVPRRLARALRRGLAADAKARHASMHTLLAELRPLVGARRRLWLGGAALVVVTASASAGLWAMSAESTHCTGGEAAVAEVWTPARRDALEAGFMATEVVHAANTWKLVQGRLDAVTAAWSAARLDACEATRVRGEQSAEVLDQRMVCLDRQLDEFDRLLDFLGEPDAKVIENAVSLVLDLPPADKCDAAAVLSAAPQPDESPELAALAQAISHARRLHRVGKYKQALEHLAPVIERLTVIDAPSLLARALTARAQTGYIDSRPEAREWITAALAAAMRTGDDQRFAEVAANQLSLVSTDVDARELWLRLGEAALQRHGGDDSTRAKLLTNYGNALRNEGRLGEAEVAHREALALRRRSPEGPTLIADGLFNVGSTIGTAGRIAEARALQQEAAEIWIRELGPQHPRIVNVFSSLATMARSETDYVAARAHSLRAIELAIALRGPDHPDLAQILAGLASAENWSGDFVAAAQHFERARAILANASPGSVRPERYAALLLVIASFRIDVGDLDGAEADITAARAMDVKFPPVHPFWTGESIGRAQIALARGDLDAAERELTRARECAAKSTESTDPGTSYIQLYQAELDLRRGRLTDALALLEPLLTAFPAEFKHPYNRALLEFLRARVLWARGEEDRARAAAEVARASYAGLGPGFDPREAEVTAWLAAHAPR